MRAPIPSFSAVERERPEAVASLINANTTSPASATVSQMGRRDRRHGRTPPQALLWCNGSPQAPKLLRPERDPNRCRRRKWERNISLWDGGRCVEVRRSRSALARWDNLFDALTKLCQEVLDQRDRSGGLLEIEARHH